MVVSSSDDFQVTWKNPEDAKLSWSWDKMHYPRALAPLAGEAFEILFPHILGGRLVMVNGYPYNFGMEPPPPPPEIFQRGAADVWENDNLPKVKAYCKRIRTTDFDQMTVKELAGSLRSLLQENAETFLHTMTVVIGFMMPTSAFVDFCEAEFGADGAVLAATVLQGYENESAAAGAGLSSLAESAAKSPEVVRALREGRFDGLEKVAGGREFLNEFNAYLNEYGWRLETWAEVHVPTWIEDPTVPLRLIARYVSDPERSPAAAIQRSQAQRQAAMREAESKLSGEKLAQFRALLNSAQAHVSISEGRALWQLITVGELRIPLLALGRKLVAAGVIGEANDVFFLYIPEIEAAANDPKPLRDVVGKRKADLARWERLVPPPFIGGPPGPPPAGPMESIGRRFFGFGVMPTAEAKVVTGNAASKGTARGRARVIMSLRDADRLEPGDVLVCPSTAPPWTPLFAIAAAVVTDTGGVLCHSAICAREYGIPCVVGTQVGTQKIPDGAMITVDGSKGIVTIE